MSSISFATYNSHGFGTDRIEYMKKIVTDILLIQEHWLLESRIPGLEDKINDVHVHGMSGMLESDIQSGRLFAVVAIVWKRNIRCKITPISVLSRRMCAIILTINNFDIILFIVYMPCDTLYVHNNQLQYNELLHEISHACTDHNVHQIIVGGDFNTDFSHQASLYTKFLTAYMDNDFLKNVYIHILSKIDYTYCSKINKERSCIDHFLLSDNLFNIRCQYE